ncbi:MAG: hypothetical protein K6A33_05950 [Clostridiales bacterium]|jgi:hypothetical protein|nr:hypothetical protein [Clostridiales bacterium]
MNEWEELKESLGLTPAKGYTPSPAFESLDRLIRVVRLPKGGALPEPPEPEVYLLYAGVLICAVERAGGEAFIDNILWKPGTMYFDIHRVAGDACPVRKQVIAAEPAVLIALPIAAVDAVNLEDAPLFRLYAKRHEENITDLRTHKNVLLCMSASERYDWFLENYPGLIDRVQHRRIASFLNMTPVSLSRIRHAKRAKT